jgi:phosphoglycerate dehydrogenase-like enzyme
MTVPLTIWFNAGLPDSAMSILQSGVVPHRLLFAAQRNASNLTPGVHDPLLDQADIAYGQPDPQQIVETPRVKWIHLTTAGYTRYDTAAFRSAMNARGGVLTNSSHVYDEPCAQHLLAMILSLARRLPNALIDQRDHRGWPSRSLRATSYLLGDQTALIYGFGNIARRLVELLAPLHMNVIGVRRHPRGDEGIRVITPEEADALLPQADHVIDILPAAADTENFFHADRLARLKPTANFYNIGRGATVDQIALQVALETHKIAAAYLDVTTPEPLPGDHPLWHIPNCYITPHTAGGHTIEFERGVRHFLDNLHRYTAGHPLLNRVF